ncbi:MAG: glycosyltransferase family 4 protein [Lachnospiraceae bacterium]|nr:glycosyltransferase family 4 protein [Lachnospiraceae bacterium]
MKLCFVLPGFSKSPAGGYKIIYEYANRLAERGYDISLLYYNAGALKRYHLPEPIRKIVSNYLIQKGPSWFDIDKRVRSISLYDRKFRQKVTGTDIIVYTSVDTVLLGYRILDKCNNNLKKVYFIQGYENWTTSNEKCQNTYNLGMTNIVISNWLKNIVDQYSKKPSILIKDPIDLTIYKINKPTKERRLHTIGLLYHTMPHKGLSYAIEALKKLKEKYPDMEAYMFGVPDHPKDFPDWIHYTKKATQQQTVEIYNKVSVWLCATVDEGFGLTGLEAMACGDVLVSTAYTGVFEYAKGEYNALLSPVKDVDALVKNVERVFEDEELRDKLVRNAQESVKAFGWNIAVDKFEKAIKQ